MGYEFTSIFFVGDFNIIPKHIDSIYCCETYFGSDPKEEHKSNLQSSPDIPSETQDIHT